MKKQIKINNDEAVCSPTPTTVWRRKKKTNQNLLDTVWFVKKKKKKKMMMMIFRAEGKQHNKLLFILTN